MTTKSVEGKESDYG